MIKFPNLRVVALAFLAVGTLQLGTAQASEAWDQCDEEAAAVLVAVCDEIMDGEWTEGYMEYTCDENGHLESGEGYCANEA